MPSFRDQPHSRWYKKTVAYGDDTAVRTAAFDWLTSQVSIHGDVLPRSLLQRGFVFRGERVPLVSPQGIFKPRILELPLTITTVPDGPYPDAINNQGYLSYRYRGTKPDHRDNRGLRAAMETRTPLIYFAGIVKGRYHPIWPVFIIGDDPARLTFTVDVSSGESVGAQAERTFDETDTQRQYAVRSIRQRLHQRVFREQVLRAYRTQCSLCRLRHLELLDAAHIIPDSNPAGIPIVRNGLALCKLHHAAFDSHILAVTPDYRVEVREDIRDEEDGPMLRFGLQAVHGQRIHVPRRLSERPDPELLDRRYQSFREAI